MNAPDHNRPTITEARADLSAAIARYRDDVFQTAEQIMLAVWADDDDHAIRCARALRERALNEHDDDGLDL